MSIWRLPGVLLEAHGQPLLKSLALQSVYIFSTSGQTLRTSCAHRIALSFHPDTKHARSF
jgi:hypothetical protein